jgi:hypothetical protein
MNKKIAFAEVLLPYTATVPGHPGSLEIKLTADAPFAIMRVVASVFNAEGGPATEADYKPRSYNALTGNRGDDYAVTSLSAYEIQHAEHVALAIPGAYTISATNYALKPPYDLFTGAMLPARVVYAYEVGSEPELRAVI